MHSNFLHLINYLFLLVIIIFIYFFTSNFYTEKVILKSNIENKYLSDKFLEKFPVNIKSIEDLLTNNNFISSYYTYYDNKNLKLVLKIREPFAKNIKLEKIIFKNSLIVDSSNFNSNFIENIKLEDITENMLAIDKILIAKILTLNNFDKFSKIEFIDNRRYDLFLNDGRKIMFPRVINFQLIDFINDKLIFFMSDINFTTYLDLRNFSNDTIRMK